MRQTHRAGEKAFIDYSGKKPHIVDPNTGECIDVELFVAVLGASNYTYVEATATQRGPDFIASNENAFAYFGGVPGAVVPDQLKSGVTKPCWYEPLIWRTYEVMARHYGTAVLPARPKHPRDKPKVEGGVLIAQRWILARISQRDLLLADGDERTDWRAARDSEQPNDAALRQESPRALRAGRQARAQAASVGAFRVRHLEESGGEHRLPRRGGPPFLLGPLHAPGRTRRVEARFTASTVELYRSTGRVTSHMRSYVRGAHTTKPEHMPKAHLKHLEWTPSRIVHWASTIGPNTKALVEAILADRPHPEMGYRSCLGILRLSKDERFGPERLEPACARALLSGARSFHDVASILKHGLDRVPLPQRKEQSQAELPLHENIRGRGYYH